MWSIIPKVNRLIVSIKKNPEISLAILTSCPEILQQNEKMFFSWSYD
jgi:hypothetical protein